MARRVIRIILLPVFFVVNVVWDILLLPLFVGASIVKSLTGKGEEDGK